MLYFLHGDTAPLQIRYQELLTRIRNENPDIGEKYFDTIDKEDEERFFQTVSTMSMFAPKEILVYKRVENMKGLGEFLKSIAKYDVSQKEIILLYEEMLTEFGRIQNPVGKKELDLAQSLGKVICYRKAEQKNAMLLMIQKELGISEGEADKFIEVVGENYFKIQNEVQKVKNYLQGDRFSLKAVMPILSVDKEYSMRKLVDDFLLKKERDNLLETLRRDKEYLGFFYMIAEELLLYLKLIAISEENARLRSMNFDNFKKCIEPVRGLFQRFPGQSVNEYGLYKKMPNAARFSKDFLRKKLSDLLRAEYSIKSGAMDEEIAAETWITDFHRA